MFRFYSARICFDESHGRAILFLNTFKSGFFVELQGVQVDVCGLQTK